MKGKHNPKIDSSKKTKLLTVGFRYHRENSVKMPPKTKTMTKN